MFCTTTREEIELYQELCIALLLASKIEGHDESSEKIIIQDAEANGIYNLSYSVVLRIIEIKKKIDAGQKEQTPLDNFEQYIFNTAEKFILSGLIQCRPDKAFHVILLISRLGLKFANYAQHKLWENNEAGKYRCW